MKPLKGKRMKLAIALSDSVVHSSRRSRSRSERTGRERIRRAIGSLSADKRQHRSAVGEKHSRQVYRLVVNQTDSRAGSICLFTIV